jgi:quinohemoprotein ethanol dehydrogenase
MPHHSASAKIRSWGAPMLMALASSCVLASPPAYDDKGLSLDSQGKNWPAYGRTYNETHASPLRQITAKNIQRLGLLWSMELQDVHNGGTVPIEVDGVIYFTVDQSMVHAVDARTGRLLWRFDPEVGKAAGRKLRYSWGPRGVAFWNGKVFVGTTDGRLIAIDATTGKQMWSQLTVQANDVRTITGAPRVFNGKVIVGHGGADFAQIRGYVTAYDADTGRELWRFYTVPGDPKDGFENPAMKMAASTWTGERWKKGGGGTVWNAITYDRDFNRLYIGAGDGSPGDRKIRSPGGGDNLFLSSIIALDANTGDYVWHYQTTPGESWDYNSAMDMILTTLKIDGEPRKVILHAPKNGFFYVIDRESGKLISAEKFTKVTWAERVDSATGRPVETQNAHYDNGGLLVWPGYTGGHSWAPMSYNAATGLVYLPVMQLGSFFPIGSPAAPENNTPDNIATSWLSAWDPVRQREAWRVPTPGLWNGGTLTTAGDLVFQGQADGKFLAYAAESGRLLWSFDARMGISGAAISYAVGGKQYISIVAGWGGSVPGFFGPGAAQFGWVSHLHRHRLLTFALDAKGNLPADIAPPSRVTPIDDPAFAVDPDKAKQGAMLFLANCGLCHGYSATAGGFAPDLRASAVPLSPEAFSAVVKHGELVAKGMPIFDEFSDEQLDMLRQFIRASARESLAAAASRIH